jgi:hypothetical protein
LQLYNTELPRGQPKKFHLQELRTVSACSLSDEVCHRLIGEMAFERVPALDLSAPASNFQLHEGAQSAEEMVANGGLPAHEELLGAAELLEGAMVALDAPMLAMNMEEIAPSGFHALFFRGSKAA